MKRDDIEELNMLSMVYATLNGEIMPSQTKLAEPFSGTYIEIENTNALVRLDALTRMLKILRKQ